MREWININPSNLFVLTRNNTLGIEEWISLGIVTCYYTFDNRVQFEGNEIKVSIPCDRLFKIKQLEIKSE